MVYSYTAVKPSVVIKTALGLLQRQIVLPQLITSWGINEMVNALGDTVNVKLYGRASANTHTLRATDSTRTLVTGNLTESSIPVTLDTAIDCSVGLTDESITLDITDFSWQVTQPQIYAMAQAMEDYVATKIQALTYNTTVALDSSDPQASFNEVDRVMNVANVPRGNRVVVCGPTFASTLLNDEKFQNASVMGVTDRTALTALEEAQLRRASGFDFYVSNALPAKYALAFHPTAFVFVNGAPMVPPVKNLDGATASVGSGMGSFAMRWIKDYDTTNRQMRSTFESYCGFAGIPSTETATLGKIVRAVPITLA